MAYKQCITNGSTIRETAGYPTYPSGGAHGGIDTVHTNHEAYAPKSGTVVVAHKWQGGTTGVDSWGNYIVVKMSDGNYWLAAHFSSQIHYVGKTISAGDYIGEQGTTGNVTGIHTHWEYWVGGQSTAYRKDPSSILGIPNGVGTYSVEWYTGDEPTPPTPEPGTVTYEIKFTPKEGTYKKPFRVSVTATKIVYDEYGGKIESIADGEIEYTLSKTFLASPTYDDTYVLPIMLNDRCKNYLYVKFTPITDYDPDNLPIYGDPIYDNALYVIYRMPIWMYTRVF